MGNCVIFTATVGVTVTFNVAFVVEVPSDAVKVKLAFVAEHAAATVAVIAPLVLTMFDTVTPFTVALVVPLTVTVTAPFPSSSVTLAIVAFADTPCCRVTGTEPIVGGVANSNDPMSTADPIFRGKDTPR